MLKLNVQANLLEGLPTDAEDYNRAMYMVGAFSDVSGSSASSSSTMSGSILSTQGRWKCYIYFRAKEVRLPPCATKVYMKEVRAAHQASGGSGGVIQESEVCFFKFGRFRKYGTPHEIVIRLVKIHFERVLNTFYV